MAGESVCVFDVSSNYLYLMIKCCLQRGGERRGVIVMFLYKSRAQHVLQWPLLGQRSQRIYLFAVAAVA